MYTTNAALELSGDVSLGGDGLEYVFSLGQFTVFLGDFLGAYPTHLIVLGYLWLWMIAGSFLLIVLPGRWRTGFVALLMAMHIGMLVTMRIDLFPPDLCGLLGTVSAHGVLGEAALSTRSLTADTGYWSPGRGFSRTTANRYSL